jgi:hypothetical protein
MPAIKHPVQQRGFESHPLHGLAPQPSRKNITTRLCFIYGLPNLPIVFQLYQKIVCDRFSAHSQELDQTPRRQRIYTPVVIWLMMLQRLICGPWPVPYNRSSRAASSRSWPAPEGLPGTRFAVEPVDTAEPARDCRAYYVSEWLTTRRCLCRIAPCATMPPGVAGQS